MKLGTPPASNPPLDARGNALSSVAFFSRTGRSLALKVGNELSRIWIGSLRRSGVLS